MLENSKTTVFPAWNGNIIALDENISDSRTSNLNIHTKSVYNVYARGRRGLGSTRKIPGWAGLGSPAQARKRWAGPFAHGPKIVLCNKNPNKIASFCVLEELFFHQNEIFQNMPKLMMKLSLRNLAPLNISSFIFIGLIWAHLGQPMGWTWLFWAFLILAQSSPSRKIPAHADP